MIISQNNHYIILFSILYGDYSLKLSETKFTYININDENKRLLFLDPPLYGDMHDNFNNQLLIELIKTKRNWIMFYNNDYIKSLYKDFILFITII